MSRNLIVGLAVLIVAALGWFAFDRIGDSRQEAARIEAEAEAVALAEEEEAARLVAEAEAEAALEVERMAAEAAAEAAEAEANRLAEDAAATGSDAVDAVDDAADDAAVALTEGAEAVGDAADATTDAITDAVEPDAAEVETETTLVPITPAEDVATDTATDADLDTLLTTDGFDADALLVYVDESDLDTMAKTALTSTIEAARNSPEMVEGAIMQIRTQMGME